MVFYIALIIFHNQHESNPVCMIFYITVIIYDLVIISLTYCFLNTMLSPHVNPYFFFLKIYQNTGQKLGSNNTYIFHSMCTINDNVYNLIIDSSRYKTMKKQL